jgi:hypothetical protein
MAKGETIHKIVTTAYYNTQNRDEQKKAASTASGGLKLQDNVKTILGVKD